MPSYDKSRVFNTCLWITTIGSIVVSICFLLTVDLISPDIAFIKDNAFFFILIAIMNSVTLTTGNAFLSFRKADLRFVQNIIMGSRLPLLLPLVTLGSLGIFFSFGVSNGFAAIFALVLIHRSIKISPEIDTGFIKKTIRFSSQNYFANLLTDIPILIMPILILYLLSPEDAALYYIAFAIGNLVLIIPDAMTTSFFVEGSYGLNLRKGVFRTLAVTYALLLPAVLIIYLFGDTFLCFFGQNYRGAFDLLKIITVSSIFVTVYNLFIPLQNIRLRVRGIVILNVIRFGLLMGLNYIFLIRFGLVGAGYAWLSTYMIISAGIILFAKKESWI
jgi:O-antigen/teichoic acid export membrane protein